MTPPRWIPAPRRFDLTGGVCRLDLGALAVPADLAPGTRARLLQLRENAAPSTSPGAGVEAGIDPAAGLPAQGYLITVTPAGARLAAADAAGLFYAAGVFGRLLAHYGTPMPCCRVEDWPDFPVRGLMLDISRDKVPAMETLYDLADLLADLRLNQLQLYTEHTFAYANHRRVWNDADPMTPDQIRELDAYCAERFIELAPNQNSFGHLRRWLIHAEYRHLAECEGPFNYPWGGQGQGPFSLDPRHPGSLALLEEWYDELLPCFRSRRFNVGCDETFDLGAGRSRRACEAQGKGRVYLDFLLRIHRAVRARGSQMMFWGDIILQHPELAPELPDDAIVLNWGYEADHPFEAQCACFAAAGKPFYVCPGTSSWNSIVGRTANAWENLDRAAAAGRAHGAQGYLITDWGDNGHWQPFSVSVPPLAAGAGLAWRRETHRPEAVAAAVDAQLLAHEGCGMAGIFQEMGDAYRSFAARTVNRSWLHTLLAASDDQVRRAQVAATEVDAAETVLRRAARRLQAVRPQSGAGAVMQREGLLAASLAAFGCRRWLALQAGRPRPAPGELDELLEEFQDVWRQRNRPGGLRDSLARFDPVREFVAWTRDSASTTGP